LRARTVTVYMQMRRLPTEGTVLHWHRFERVLEWDRACAVLLNRSLSPAYERLWVALDRMGDFGPWCAFILALALLGGRDGVRCALHMLGAGASAVCLYKFVKNYAGRPCVHIEHVRRCVEPADEFSFPSGHTLHAVVFTVVALAYYPMLAYALVPFTVMVAISRVALGLHYPSDVFAGAAIGAGIALLSFLVF
jgi:undecaprenyl-diphosphatase